MDQETPLPVADPAAEDRSPEPQTANRREVLKYGVTGLVCAACGTGLVYYLTRRAQSVAVAEVFKGGAPGEKLWKLWKQRGWVREARHCLKLGANIQCGLCPNECLLEPDDRGRCRNRVHKEGSLWTMAYGNPCAFHVDPIEKKPLFHFVPSTGVFSIATSGCGFRCLNCQNWDISQRKPEETKDPRGEPIQLTPAHVNSLGRADVDRMSMFPDDVVAMAEFFHCPSIAYTYSEPTVWFEYMLDTAKAARTKGLKNVWVTCGYIQEEPLVELCKYIDAANVDLKSFDDAIYTKLNSGKLEPILSTLKILKREGVWFEVTNLVVPTYTDKPEMIRQMCDWLVENLGPDYPLHFSRFHPAHKLTHLPPTPVEVLVEARDLAHNAGLNYVYIGNSRGIEDAETTFCPGCKEPVIVRTIYDVQVLDVDEGKCRHCSTAIAGVWS